MKKICCLFILFLTISCQAGDGGSDEEVDVVRGVFELIDNCDSACWRAIIAAVVIIFVLGFGTYKVIACCRYFDEKQARHKARQWLLENFIQQNNRSKYQDLETIANKMRLCPWRLSYIQHQQLNYVSILHQNIQIINERGNNKFPYLKIEIEADDKYGPSKLDGAIKQSKNSLEILMLKDYKNKSLAQQKGDFSILVYEGQSNNIEEGFSGSWYFHFKKDSNGSWMWRQ